MRLKRRLGAALAAAAIIFAGTMPNNVRGQEYVDPTPESALAAGPAGVVKHVIVVIQENVSFDHYFGTYPVAANKPGESTFHALPGTPSVNGLTASLIANNPNSTKPFRLSPAQASTCDENHDYMPEQLAYDFGLMDKFPENTGVGPCKGSGTNSDYGHGPGLVMGYYDGNTVTAMWNYAQVYALSDNFYQTQFGPSTPGHINLISGNTNGATEPSPNNVVNGTIIGDPRPDGDACTPVTAPITAMSGKNVGDLLNAKSVTWGFFQGGFDLTIGGLGCARSHTSTITQIVKKDYIPHHQPFQYYKSTQNLNHARRSSISMIGKTDAAKHQYDIHDFVDATNAGHMPAVAYLKAPGYQDGHPNYSDPLDEQTFVVDMINFIQARPEWNNTVIFITWDDSDGWYDHQMGPVLIDSASSFDALSGPGKCGNHAGKIQGRCGYGMRIPIIAISPFAKQNFVDNTTTDFTSVLQFVEDTFGLGRIGGNSLDAQANPLYNMFDFAHPNPRKLHLSDKTGEPM